MERRGFLSLLGLGVTGAALAESLPKWLVFDPKRLTDTAVTPATLQAITEAMLIEFERALDRPTRLVRGAKINSRLTRLVVNTGPIAAEKEYLVHERLIAPAAFALANAAQDRGFRVFGTLPRGEVPGTSSVLATSPRASIRGVFQCQYATDEYMLRFDILGSQ